MMPPPDRRMFGFFYSGDRRKWNDNRMRLFLVLSIFFYLCAISLASTGTDSLQEHSEAVMGFQWWIIGGLLLIANTLIGFIYIGGQAASRKSNSDLKVDMKQGHADMNKRLDDIFSLLENKQDIHACDKLREACSNFKKTDRRGDC
jgi:hypothetical protein